MKSTRSIVGEHLLSAEHILSAAAVTRRSLTHTSSYVTSSYILCHIIIHTMSHHHAAVTRRSLTHRQTPPFWKENTLYDKRTHSIVREHIL
jgi:hypothetical protein